MFRNSMIVFEYEAGFAQSPGVSEPMPGSTRLVSRIS